jgi:hypothetical protein
MVGHPDASEDLVHCGQKLEVVVVPTNKSKPRIFTED